MGIFNRKKPNAAVVPDDVSFTVAERDRITA